MNRVTFWHHWLLIVSLVITAIGLFMALLNQTPLFDLFSRQIDRAFWDSAPLPVGVTSFQRRCLFSEERELTTMNIDPNEWMQEAGTP